MRNRLPKQRSPTTTGVSVVSYADKLKRLGSIKSFDSRVFLEGSDDELKVARFVLALAAVHNDLNDVNLAFSLLREVAPQGPRRTSREFGLHHALTLQLTKRLFSIIHELLNLVRDNGALFELNTFKKLHQRVPSTAKNAWADILSVAGNKPRSSALAKHLADCRDQIANHYEMKPLAKGFQRFVAEYPDVPPMLSLGNSAEEVRFYFTDAAVHDVVAHHSKTNLTAQVMGGDHNLLFAVDTCLYFFVTHFIQLRGGVWRDIDESKLLPNEKT